MTPTLRERLNTGAGIVVGAAFADGRRSGKRWAGRKPWSERDKAPWGEADGDDNGVFQIPPGDEDSVVPHSEPDNDEQVRLRYTTATAAESIAGKDPDAFRALLAIEARLAEITTYLPAAMRGFQQGEVLSKLQFLQSIL